MTIVFCPEKDILPDFLNPLAESVKVSEFAVKGLIGSLKVTETVVWGSIPVAPLGGLILTIEGDVVSVVIAVVKLLMKSVPTPPLPTMRLPAMSVTPE